MASIRHLQSRSSVLYDWLNKSRHTLVPMVFQERQMSSRGGPVYVYNGEGTTENCFKQMFDSLSRCLDHTVLPIGPQTIIKGDWKSGCAGIVFGGGNTSGFVKALGHEGAGHVQDYVWYGGTYVGVCAGAYFACCRVLYQQRGQLGLILEERPLKFYPGNVALHAGWCIGPVNREDHPITSNPHDEEDAWQKVSFHVSSDHRHDVERSDDVITLVDVTTVRTYVNGGGLFVMEEGGIVPTWKAAVAGSPVVVDVLARFVDVVGQPAAVVQCQVGKGVATLSSPHLELTTSDKDDALRAAWWRRVLHQSRLRTLGPRSPPPRPSPPTPTTGCWPFCKVAHVGAVQFG